MVTQKNLNLMLLKNKNMKIVKKSQIFDIFLIVLIPQLPGFSLFFGQSSLEDSVKQSNIEFGPPR